MAIEHAGVNNNTVDPTPAMVKDSLRAVMNSPGEKVGPKDLVKALALIRAGEAIDYSGSYGDNDWDENGDIKGEITYNILSINPSTGQWQTIYQEQLFVP